jgi:hypothetical protein
MLCIIVYLMCMHSHCCRLIKYDKCCCKNKYGFLLVETNRIKGSIISCCIAMPSVTVTTNIPSCSNTDPILVILAIETAIRLVIPIGVILIIIFTSILIIVLYIQKTVIKHNMLLPWLRIYIFPEPCYVLSYT